MSTPGLNVERRGASPPLLLVHGLGESWPPWSPILDDLAEHREVIAIDLPGFGDSAPLAGEVSIATLTDAVADFIAASGLDGVDTVGSSMGARMVLELARRGIGGDTVALDPGRVLEPGGVAVLQRFPQGIAAVAVLRRSLAVVEGCCAA